MKAGCDIDVIKMMLVKARKKLATATKFQGTTGKNKMPEIIADNISVINSDELEGTTRIDAEYYQPKYLKVKGKLNQFKPLKFYTENIIHPHEIKRIYYGYGETFLLTQNVRPLRYLRLTYLRYLRGLRQRSIIITGI